MRRIAILFALLVCGLVQASPYEETRYCGPPKRDKHGVIVRSPLVLLAFKSWHPCPSTGKRSADGCPGWAMDHVIPLACGGCDSVSNLQWLPLDLKARKDKFERRIYGADPPIQGTRNCTFPAKVGP